MTDVSLVATVVSILHDLLTLGKVYSIAQNDSESVAGSAVGGGNLLDTENLTDGLFRWHSLAGTRSADCEW